MKNTLKKAILGVLSITLLAGSLAGCGGIKDDGLVHVEFYSTTKETDEASYNIYMKNHADFTEYYKTAFPDEKQF